MTFLLVLGFALLIVVILSKDSQKQSTITYPLKLQYKFNLKYYNKINEGEKVKLWHKPDTKYIHFYAAGTYGGDGLIGRKKSPLILNHLNNNFKYKALILKKVGNFITINVTLIKE